MRLVVVRALHACIYADTLIMILRLGGSFLPYVFVRTCACNCSGTSRKKMKRTCPWWWRHDSICTREGGIRAVVTSAHPAARQRVTQWLQPLCVPDGRLMCALCMAHGDM